MTLKGKTDITAAVSGWFDNPHARISMHFGEISFDRIRAATVHLTGIWQGLPGPENRIDDLHFTAREMGMEQVGTGALSLAGNWYGWIDNPSAHFSIEARNVAGDRLNIEMLDLTGDFKGHPSADDSQANLTLTAGGVSMDRIESGALSITGSWRGPFSRYVGHAEINAHETDIQNNLFKNLFLAADVTPDEAAVSLSAEHGNGSRLEISGKAAPWTTPEKDITIGNLRVVTLSPWPESNLINAEPIRFSLTGNNGIRVHTCRFDLNDAEISIEGDLAASGEQDLKLAINNLELSDVPGKWNQEARLSGTVSHGNKD